MINKLKIIVFENNDQIKIGPADAAAENIFFSRLFFDLI